MLNATAPTVYEYYTADGIQAGLDANNYHLTLNNKNLTIYSGALHYFRVPSEYWRDRIQKFKAAGLNTIETYVPWNLHELNEGVYDFGKGGSDFGAMLDMVKFLKTVQEEDMLAIVRPGPYICSEWEFGGLPAWLLNHDDMKVRTSNKKYMHYVTKYFNVLLTMLAALQFTKGGPIIAFQVENEYGNTFEEGKKTDLDYLQQLVSLFKKNKIVELLFTSDTPLFGNSGQIPGVWYTANFQTNAKPELDQLQKYQPGKASMVMEFWSGWYNHWGEVRETLAIDKFTATLEDILSYPASVNFYMMHGGTSFGFMNGANILQSGIAFDINSYDYDAPLSENGDYTDKYNSIKTLLANYSSVKFKLPAQPALIKRVAYEPLKIDGMLTLIEFITHNNFKRVKSARTESMEYYGQNFGYILYSKLNLHIAADSKLEIRGSVADTLQVLIDNDLMTPVLNSTSDYNSFGYWKLDHSLLEMKNTQKRSADLHLLVENWGRNNYGKLSQFEQFKGLKRNKVLLNDVKLSDFSVILLEFHNKTNNNIKNWHKVGDDKYTGPALYKFVLKLDKKPVGDTYIDMRDWKKGIVIVNGFVLSRYCRFGPQQSIYLPAPFLDEGDNVIIVFEHYQRADGLKFVTDPIYETVDTLHY